MNASEKSTILRRTAPCFLVRNVPASLDYYHNELGFSRPPMRSSPVIAMPARDGFIFILVQGDRDQAIIPNHLRGGRFQVSKIWTLL